MPRTVQPGQLLDGRYRLIDTIGHGGMSTVWRARDERLGRIAAVKILAAGLLLDSASRLRTEAQALARLHHPHIAEVYDYGTGDVPYLVMELVDGVPLSRALAGGASLPWAQAASVAAQTASALAAAHQRGMVHRDVASGNILLTAAGVKLIDFGISASEGNIEADRGETLVGTPAYLAPERIAGHPVQPESDVYALGVVLYRMLSGHFPFEAEDAGKLIRAHRDLPPPPLPAVSGMPAIVADLCRSCLAKDPASRPAAADLAHSLFDLLGSAITVPVPIGAAADDFLPTHLLPWPDGTKPAGGCGTFAQRTVSQRAGQGDPRRRGAAAGRRVRLDGQRLGYAHRRAGRRRSAGDAAVGRGGRAVRGDVSVHTRRRRLLRRDDNRRQPRGSHHRRAPAQLRPAR